MAPAPWPDLPATTPRTFWLETAFVAGLFWVPMTLATLVPWPGMEAAYGPQASWQARASVAVGFLSLALQTLLPMLLLLLRSGTVPSTFGLRRPALLDLGLALLLLAAARPISHFAFHCVTATGLDVLLPPVPPFGELHPPSGALGTLLFTCAIALMVFAEELVYRGWLQSRLWAATGSTVLAILVNSAVFGLSHRYQGAYGMLSAFFLGLAGSAVFAWRRSLWPVAIEHALFNLSLTYFP